MPNAPDLDALLASVAKRQRGLPPAVAEARRKEQSRRGTKAQNLARHALTHLHYEDYAALYRQAIVKVNAECGPLPGDEVA